MWGNHWIQHNRAKIPPDCLKLSSLLITHWYWGVSKNNLKDNIIIRGLKETGIYSRYFHLIYKLHFCYKSCSFECASLEVEIRGRAQRPSQNPILHQFIKLIHNITQTLPRLYFWEFIFNHGLTQVIDGSMFMMMHGHCQKVRLTR